MVTDVMWLSKEERLQETKGRIVGDEIGKV